MKNLIKLLVITTLIFSVEAVYAKTDIGKVYGDKTWIAYIGSGSGIYLRRGYTDFAVTCDTGFVSKNKYVLAPDGSSYSSKKSILTAIQRRLIRGKYKNSGCK